jgi:translation initiation factor IF-2
MANTQHKTSSTLAVLALIIAIPALIIAWLAYNRSGQDLETEISAQAQESVEYTRQQIALLEARARILYIRTQLLTEENLDEAEQELAQVRSDLNEEFANARTEVKQQWQQIDTQLEDVEANLRTGTAESIEAVRQALMQIENEIRTDE